MKNFTPLFCFALLVCFSIKSFAQSDTTIVQTFDFNSTTRSGVFQFPNDTATYEKILMQYRMRCKDGLVSTGSNTNLGCGEWDYSCNTYITDSSMTDSVKSTAPSHIISNFSGTKFYYSNSPTYTYTEYNQKSTVYDTVFSEDTFTIGAGADALSHPFTSSLSASRAQYLWTAAELTAAGVDSGAITGIKLDVSALGSQLSFLKIKIKHTTKTAMDSSNLDLTGWTEVFFLDKSFASTGIQAFNFYRTFIWNGSSNLLIDFSFSNAGAGTDNEVLGGDAGFVAGMTAGGDDYYLKFDGSQAVNVNASAFSNITDEITISFWSYGDPAKMPANSTIFEGGDAGNNRQANVHLPWGDGVIYWDCGNDGSGYDRIQKGGSVADYEGKWSYWAFTKNAATGSMKIYLNGTLWSSGSGKTKPINITKFNIGSAVTWSNFYYGFIDEFSVWNKELDAATIQGLMHRSISPSHPFYSNLMAYYPLNEGTGTVLNDASAFAAASSASGNPSWLKMKGENILRDFSGTAYRPNIIFVQGVYSSTTQDIFVRDSFLNAPNSVYSFQLAGNDQVQPVDTVFVWQAGYMPVYNTGGIKVDSVYFTMDDSITITTLNYFSKWAQKLELMSFVTPYGINLDLGMNGKMWLFDVSDYAPVLKGSKLVTVERGGEWQEDMDISFMFIKGTPPRKVLSVRQLWPVTHDGYGSIMNNDRYEPRNITLNPQGSYFKIRSAITGHGQEGEFIPRTHFININGGVNEFQWQVWKACAKNPVYPQGGTWVYDRAGWCPGAPTDLKEYDITSMVAAGQSVQFDYGVTSGSGDSRYIVNNQLVQYGAANFSLDAALVEIRQPTDRVEYSRTNPICDEPVVTIRNNGSTLLTSLAITFAIDGNTPQVYNWAGSLGFMQSTDVSLGDFNWNGTSGYFTVSIDKPNGGTDEYAKNNSLKTSFSYPAVMPEKIVIELKTNTRPNENSYTLKDMYGGIIKSKSGLSSNTIYRDTFTLTNGCYEFRLTDTGEDGLQWWASSQGTGYLRIKDAVTGAIIKNFEPDFGGETYMQFSYGVYTSLKDDGFTNTTNFRIYPNPSAGEIYVNIDFPRRKDATVEIYDLNGRKVFHHTIRQQRAGGLNIDFSRLPKGMYMAVLRTDTELVTRKVMIE